MTDSEHDDDFEAYLKRRVPINERMKSLERMEPPPELDRVVIGKARQAIKGPAPLPLYRAPRWALAVGLAATVLISLSLLLELKIRIFRDKDPPVAQATSQRSPFKALPAPSPEAPAAVPAAGALASPAPVAPLPKAAHQIANKPWAPVAGAGAAKDAVASDNPRSRATEHAVEANRLRKGDDPGIEEMVVTRRSVAASNVASAKRAAAPSPAPHAAASNPVSATQATAPSPAPHAAASNLAPATAPPPAASAVAAPATPADATAASDRREHPDPATWLAHIEKLRDQGLAVAADSELQRFRDAYPHYSPPTDAPAADGRAQ